MGKRKGKLRMWGTLAAIVAVAAGCLGEGTEAPLAKQEGGGDNAALMPVSAGQSSAPVREEAAFGPDQVKVGDAIGGMTLAELDTGNEPWEYAIARFEGELTVTGTFIRYGRLLFFMPDEGSSARIPHIKDGYGYAADGTRIPRKLVYHWLAEDVEQVLIGRGEADFSSYTVQYVPEADIGDAETGEDGSFLTLGGKKVSFTHSAEIRDEPEVKGFRVLESYHRLDGVQYEEEQGAYSWDGLKVRKELLSFYGAMDDRGSVSSMAGNHVELLHSEVVQALGEDMIYMEVKRDAYDEAKGGYYGGYTHEYWLVALRESNAANRQGQEARDAYVLIADSGELPLSDGQASMLALAERWILPPEGFILESPGG